MKIIRKIIVNNIFCYFTALFFVFPIAFTCWLVVFVDDCLGTPFYNFRYEIKSFLKLFSNKHRKEMKEYWKEVDEK